MSFRCICAAPPQMGRDKQQSAGQLCDDEKPHGNEKTLDSGIGFLQVSFRRAL